MDEAYEKLCREEGVDPGTAKLMYRSGVSVNFAEGVKAMNLTLKDVEKLYVKFGPTAMLYMTEMILLAKANTGK